MSGIHFRYSWISRSKLEQLFSPSPEIAKIRILMKAKHEIQVKHWKTNILDCQSYGALRITITWFHQPNWCDPPKTKQIRTSLDLASRVQDTELLAMLNWVSDAVKMIIASKTHQGPSYSEAVSFLQNCCNTDFPVLLLWRNLRLATQIFETDQNSNIRLRDKYTQYHRPIIQAANTCIGYALAGEARLSSRQAWVGVGFAGFKEEEIQPMVIQPEFELIHVEPDLSWINRNWQDLEHLNMQPGILPWDYLQQRIAAQSNDYVRRKYQAVYNDLIQMKLKLQENIWSFSKIIEFLNETEKILIQTVDKNIWNKDTHHWWVTRLLREQPHLSKTLLQHCDIARSRRFQELITKGHAQFQNSEQADSVNLPYPQYVLIDCPSSVIATAEEYTDWLLKVPEEKSCFPFPRLTQQKDNTGEAFRLVNNKLSYLFTDPNPRRCAERFAPSFDTIPVYFSKYQNQKNYIALMPPEKLIDNRLVRLSGNESLLNNIKENTDVFLNSTLICEQTLPLLQREMQSSRYKMLPDLVPVFISKKLPNISAGEYCEENQCWFFIKENNKSEILLDISAKQLALIYFLEIGSLLGDPDWLDLIIDGKRSAMPVHSLLVWEYVSHLLRTAKSAVVICSSNGHAECSQLFIDEDGSAISTFFMVNN